MIERRTWAAARGCIINNASFAPVVSVSETYLSHQLPGVPGPEDPIVKAINAELVPFPPTNRSEGSYLPTEMVNNLILWETGDDVERIITMSYEL